MTDTAARIGEGLPCFGNELPIVPVGLQRKFEDAKRGKVANFAVGFRRAERTVALSAGANDKFTDAAFGIGSTVRRLRSEALVVVIVAVDDDVGIRSVEGIPERFQGQIVAMRAARTEERFVPVGQCARHRMRGEIGAQPLFLRRTGFAAAHFFALAVQYDDVPRAKFVAVVAGLGIASGHAKIIKIWRGSGSVKFMIAAGRVRDFARPHVLS